MVRIFLFLILPGWLLLCGCGKAPARAPLTKITAGADYAEVRARLEQLGLKENTDQWDMRYPEGQTACTYYLGEDTALIIWVEVASNRVAGLSKYEKIDKVKSLRNWTELDAFDIEKELAGRTAGAD